ncbi:type II toxin-antitoxin system HipA family toxin [Pasteurella atlantica]|uniref:type II toxin-antitoxin system HipA family toxin n=1 Tax=Pasteurellaceae TaxID=712 RepID=UPI002757EE36|nr:type II toxin-antitoxin system HipA family toxin [Pasteurella atlantica]MDP8034571.1 type II toxin-antitoxin system HipA family toxin [Pasteurella atlantica]MDP8036482.1 type II toxin-antitoxin system HipA family toxin [Pasteurella atlantica]MDP8038457.1 type II toxin-antitoxin system HipA family toxin [Pasteurella atlantica]MDP8048788.1 type II toxin-antitoxin system HipA family toxin [Pasteurella atlantica]MDP8050739.1 type II toxin-antitoxin system HipA family toxin [Pasteurella atlantic
MNKIIGFLKLSLHNQLVGYLIGFQSGKNILIFDPVFYHNEQRPTLSLITHPNFPNASKLLSTQWKQHQRLHPLFSNLLPEGALRSLISHSLKIHLDNEFMLFSHLGQDLPGALIATPLHPDEVPPYILSQCEHCQISPTMDTTLEKRFSLAGVQMKFSMQEINGRYTVTHSGKQGGDWIIKTPSIQHQAVPQNEYSTMKLATLTGIDIPEVRLIQLGKLNNLPSINLPDEEFAYMIKRFDRNNDKRIHSEDFAQILVKYPHEKYQGANYEQIGRVLYQYSGNGLADVQQFARRLLVNILLANGDAHLKNWSLLYDNKYTPRLSPAYDIVMTRAYIENEKSFALNLGRTKYWYDVNFSHFEYWSKKADIPWRAIKPHLIDTLDKARIQWHTALKELPMLDSHKQILQQHWKSLHKDFSIIK